MVQNTVSKTATKVDVSKLQKECARMAKDARDASSIMRQTTGKQRNDFLKILAAQISKNEKSILSANAKDVSIATKLSISSAMIDRLTLNSKRLAGIVGSVREIAAQIDPLNKQLSEYKRPDGLNIARKSVAIGSIFFIFESRPNVTIDGAALCLKAGNSVILRGGKESVHSNKALYMCIVLALKEAGLPKNAVQLVTSTDHAAIGYLLKQDKYIDLVIPRGGERLIRAVVEQSHIPVIKHFLGICHIYIDATADLTKAKKIALNAKVQRPGVCNAMETLILDKNLPSTFVQNLFNEYLSSGVELRVCPKTKAWFKGVKLSGSLKAATAADWDTEYLDLVLSVRTVSGVDEAIEHIRAHGSGHTDAIVSEKKQLQQKFINGVDSSSVMVNASTRFSDGGEYGLGAEVGISTDKLHARGPMGIESLTTYQWVVVGDGHVRG